jgi:hypothetical protein
MFGGQGIGPMTDVINNVYENNNNNQVPDFIRLEDNIVENNAIKEENSEMKNNTTSHGKEDTNSCASELTDENSESNNSKHDESEHSKSTRSSVSRASASSSKSKSTINSDDVSYEYEEVEVEVEYTDDEPDDKNSKTTDNVKAPKKKTVKPKSAKTSKLNTKKKYTISELGKHQLAELKELSTHYDIDLKFNNKARKKGELITELMKCMELK